MGSSVDYNVDYGLPLIAATYDAGSDDDGKLYYALITSMSGRYPRGCDLLKSFCGIPVHRRLLNVFGGVGKNNLTTRNFGDE